MIQKHNKSEEKRVIISDEANEDISPINSHADNVHDC